MLAGYSSMSAVRIYVSCKTRRAKCIERLELDNIIGRRWILRGVSVVVEGCRRLVLRNTNGGTRPTIWILAQDKKSGTELSMSQVNFDHSGLFSCRYPRGFSA
jgi:hypothetical protein